MSFFGCEEQEAFAWEFTSVNDCLNGFTLGSSRAPATRKRQRRRWRFQRRALSRPYRASPSANKGRARLDVNGPGMGVMGLKRAERRRVEQLKQLLGDGALLGHPGTVHQPLDEEANRRVLLIVRG